MSEELKRMSDEQFKKHAEAEEKAESITAISPELLSMLTVKDDLQHEEAAGKESKRRKNPRKRTTLEKQVDAEIIAKGPEAAKDFDHTKAITVTPKVKRTRKAKVVIGVDPAAPGTEETVVSFKCKSCDELITSKNVMKIGAGKDRYAAFCPFCQRSLGFIDEVFQNRVRHIIETNPTQGK